MGADVGSLGCGGGGRREGNVVNRGATLLVPGTSSSEFGMFGLRGYLRHAEL